MQWTGPYHYQQCENYFEKPKELGSTWGVGGSHYAFFF